MKHRNTLSGQNTEFSMLKQVVCIETAGLYKVNKILLFRPINYSDKCTIVLSTGKLFGKINTSILK
jgi:hypothetical protein